MPALKESPCLLVCRPEDHDDWAASGRGQQVNASYEPVVDERLRCAHPTSCSCGEQQAGWRAIGV
jgi:hypothetical protein